MFVRETSLLFADRLITAKKTNIRRRTRSRKILSQWKTSASSLFAEFLHYLVTVIMIINFRSYLLFALSTVRPRLLIHILHVLHTAQWCTHNISSHYTLLLVYYIVLYTLSPSPEIHCQFRIECVQCTDYGHTCISPHDQLLYSLQVVFSLLLDIVIWCFVVLSFHLMLFIIIIV